MKTSIATVSLSGELPDKIRAIARAGFDGVEIFENDFIANDLSPREVGAMARDAGLVVTLFQPFRDFEGLPEPFRTKAFDRAERKFDVMQEIGTELILVCSSVSPHALGGIDRAAADLRELGERAHRRGLKIGYEALAWGRFINDHWSAWEIVRRADHPAVSIILDSFHTLAREVDVASIQAIPGDKIALVQLADAPRLQLDLLSWSRHFRTMPGQGDLPVGAFLDAVRATGYDGVLSLEIFNDQFRAGAAGAVAVDGRRSLILLDDDAKRRTQNPTGRLLPARSPCSGIEFIEFAVDEGAVAELETLVRALGFQPKGRHKSKNVTLWSQNGVNLVINSDGEGFAHSAYLMHGPAVCAMCLRVADAGAVLARAEALLATPFQQPVLEGELDIPAIRGVGGSLLYFIDDKSDLGRLWDIDFEAVDEDGANAGIGLVRIDHVAQSMEYDEMLSWLLFYTSIFDVAKAPGMDIADPGGLVRSVVLQNADGTLSLVLNGSQSQHTASARFLSEFFGSGVQHIAFETKDIFETARAIRAAGFSTLPIPENYYDDLEARYDLPDAVMADLRALGILYDRDEAGEFFQLFTRSFADRFFFEIVERRNYRGFGAPNAGVRLAAQKRLSRPSIIPRW
ncbi:bifunctional sugar phosphate isomerase/epimerase/4-hydroxyphenylpyruvate dioxygenase family protein [Lichenifustis flavocetrariae]|uniref:3-dehydroshikimate dehydratase n=1 Tax=Lichenifustis flavocetrariae TaxID=2949735 RepID=A0AA41YW69_9HYPH|nr:sugar phosphate isomerase/epimerase and 4-hydroxyphenylpyruvate domain-containing protein [Lichenifustis flavocetrariae]MCW6508430.1 sugar phosphate isomerase/epimerase and 4-hydroxyphenylpyruvate domain-containing protein [Lichenifustis flavocetrariae]